MKHSPTHCIDTQHNALLLSKLWLYCLSMGHDSQPNNKQTVNGQGVKMTLSQLFDKMDKQCDGLNKIIDDVIESCDKIQTTIETTKETTDNLLSNVEEL